MKVYFGQFFKLIVFIILTSCTSTDQVDFVTFDNLTTLTLKGYFHDDTDCGEFGGHKETIIIVKQKNQLVFSYKRDSSQCTIKSPNGKQLLSGFMEINKANLTNQKQQFVVDFVNELYSYDPSKYSSSMSNAIDHYEMELKTNVTTKIFKIDYAGNDWRKFEELRNKIIKD